MRLTKFSVFVYGTLKPGGRYWPEFCAGKVEEPFPAKIQGQLYDLHVGFPGLVITGDGWVQGYLLHFKSGKDFLRLDQLEGYNPDRPISENEYVRLKVPCFRPDGQAIGEVWAYELTEAMMQQHTASLIEDGNWPVG